jgi:hypothetical protein
VCHRRKIIDVRSCNTVFQVKHCILVTPPRYLFLYTFYFYFFGLSAPTSWFSEPAGRNRLLGRGQISRTATPETSQRSRPRIMAHEILTSEPNAGGLLELTLADLTSNFDFRGMVHFPSRTWTANPDVVRGMVHFPSQNRTANPAFRGVGKVSPPPGMNPLLSLLYCRWRPPSPPTLTSNLAFPGVLHLGYFCPTTIDKPL